MEAAFTPHRRLATIVPALPRLALGALVFLLLWQAIKISDEYYRLFELPLLTHVRDLGGSDFPAFYGGAELFLTDPGNAYDPASQGRAINEAKSVPDAGDSPWHRYYNPPVYSLILVPLTLFDLHIAYAISFMVNAVGLGLLLGVLYRLLDGRPLMFGFLAAALLTSQPVNYAFWHAQPTMYLAAFLGFVYLQIRSGKPLPAGVFWAALILKPHWLAAPLLGQARFSKRLLVSAAGAGIVLSAPFVFVGPGGVVDYINLIVGRGQSDVADQSFAEAVLSWPGFFRGITGEARVEAGLLMSALTVLYYLMVRRRGNADLLPAAGAAALLLVIPHSHPQDWIMLLPGAAILLHSQRNPVHIAVSSFLLLGIYLGLENWSSLADRRGVIYWPTLMAFCLLVWLYLLSELPFLRSARGSRAPQERVGASKASGAAVR